MAKLAILAAVFGVLLVATTAKTTMLSVDVEEEDIRGSRGCYDQIQRAQMLSSCQDFLDEISESGSARRCYGGSSRLLLRGRSHQLDQCCDQLSELDRECMCEGLEQIVRQQVQQSPRSYRGESSQKIVQCARELPRMCRMGRSCSQIRVPY